MKKWRNKILSLMLGVPGLASAMTPAQQAAFRGANTGNASFTELDSTLIIAGSATVLAFVWLSWVLMSAYKAWGAKRLSLEEAGGQALRALFVFIITIVVVAY